MALVRSGESRLDALHALYVLCAVGRAIQDTRYKRKLAFNVRS
jgi:hypothetical protein